jgi:hypothetical protein
MPDALRNKPELFPDLGTIYEAFWILRQSCASSGFGPNPISMVELQAYLGTIPGLTLDEYDRMMRLIKVLDMEYLSICNNKMERDRKLREQKSAAESRRPGRKRR